MMSSTTSLRLYSERERPSGEKRPYNGSGRLGLHQTEYMLKRHYRPQGMDDNHHPFLNNSQREIVIDRRADGLHCTDSMLRA